MKENGDDRKKPATFWEALFETLFRRWYSQLALALVIGLIALAVRAATAATPVPGGRSEFFPILVRSLLLAGAAAFSGGLLGFLFGVPRTLQGTPPAATEPLVHEALATNTNLEQISDWLSKIIVGVGLVQLRELGPALDSIASYNAPGLGGDPDSARALAASVVIYFSIDGFLLIYLWTRLYLTDQFKKRLKDIREAAYGPGTTGGSASKASAALSNSLG